MPDADLLLGTKDPVRTSSLCANCREAWAWEPRCSGLRPGRWPEGTAAGRGGRLGGLSHTAPQPSPGKSRAPSSCRRTQ